MKILSIETSASICSVAILENTNLLKKIELNNGLTHSETLMPIISQIFEETTLNLSDIDLLVCDIGPGSFTGIRIGIATIKAFSDSLNIPFVGISSLEALAYNIKNEGIICSIIDCKKNNCYFSLFKFENNNYIELMPPQTNSVKNCLDFINYKYKENTVTFVGDAANIYQEEIQNSSNKFQIANTTLNNIDVYNLGLAGYFHYKNFGKDNDLLPLYLKKPQAQKQLEEKNIKILDMTIDDLKNFNIDEFDKFWNINILKDELSSDSSHFICAKLQATIIGFIGIKTIIDETDIMNIAVKESYRNQGIGTLLLNNIINNFCISNNIKTINLEVNENNFPAINLYKKHGFYECGKRKKYYDNKYNAILMKKDLNN